MTTHLYLLRPMKYGTMNRDDYEESHWDPWFDKCFGTIVRAESPQQAREIAHKAAGDESRYNGVKVWLDDTQTECYKLSNDGPTGLVMKDFHAA